MESICKNKHAFLILDLAHFNINQNNPFGINLKKKKPLK